MARHCTALVVVLCWAAMTPPVASSRSDATASSPDAPIGSQATQTTGSLPKDDPPPCSLFDDPIFVALLVGTATMAGALLIVVGTRKRQKTSDPASSPSEAVTSGAQPPTEERATRDPSTRVDERGDGPPLLPESPVGTTLSSIFGDAGAFRIAGASQLGRDHAALARSCEDAYAVVRVPGGVGLAIADGAGQSTMAAHASRVAVGAAIKELACSPSSPADAADAALAAGRRAILRHAEDRLGEWATTLAVAVVTVDDDGAQVVGGSIGNTYIYRWTPGAMTDVGALGTTFLTWPDEQRRVTPFETRLDSAGEGVVLTTDGIGPDLERSPGIRASFAEALGAMSSPLEALAALAYHRPGSADDRTYIAVWLR